MDHAEVSDDRRECMSASRGCKRRWREWRGSGEGVESVCGEGEGGVHEKSSVHIIE